MTSIFMKTCIFRQSQITLIYYFLFCYCILWLYSNTSRLQRAIFINFNICQQRSSIKNVFLEISQNSQESTCARVSFFNIALQTLLKKRLWHRCFPENFVKFLRTSFLQKISGRLLLKFIVSWEVHRSLFSYSFAKFFLQYLQLFCDGCTFH